MGGMYHAWVDCVGGVDKVDEAECMGLITRYRTGRLFE